MSLREYKRNVRIFYITSVLNGMIAVFAPFIVIFQMQEIGMSIGEVLLIEGLFALTVMLCEIPSGIWADKFSRKGVLVFAASMFTLGILIFALSQNMWHVVVSQVIMGFGLSARSGADQAMIYDSLKGIKQSHRYQKILSDFRSIEFGTAILATIAGGYIASNFNLRGPIFCSTAMFFCVSIAWTFLVDPPREKLHQRSSFLDYGKKGFALILQTPFLFWLIVFTALCSMGLKINFHTLNPYWEAYDVPLLWFGYALAGYNTLAMITSLLIPKLSKRIGGMKILVFAWFIISIGFLIQAFAHFGALGAVIIPVVFQMSRSIIRVIPIDFLQRQTNSDTRATIISMNSFASTMSQAVFLWLFGLLADFGDLFTAFAVLGLFITVFGGLAFLQLSRAYNEDHRP